MGQASERSRREGEGFERVDGISGEDFQQYIGYQIKYTRLRRRLSQSELAELAGIDQAQVSQFENGKVLPTMGTFYKLTRALEINPGVFFTDFDKGCGNFGDRADAAIDMVARRLSQRIHKATRTDESARMIWQDYEKSGGRRTSLLARLLVKAFFEPKFKKNLRHANELGEYQKFVVGEMIGFMLSGKGDTRYLTEKEIGDQP